MRALFLAAWLGLGLAPLQCGSSDLDEPRTETPPEALYGLSEHYVEIFQITRLSDFMMVFPNEETALAGATSAPV